jgi:hypothetical protein
MSTLAMFFTIEVQTMDTFLTMAMAGVVGALVGAIAVFYLGVVREKHKQILARKMRGTTQARAVEKRGTAQATGENRTRAPTKGRKATKAHRPPCRSTRRH